MKTQTLIFMAIALVGFCPRSPCYAQSATVRGQLLRSDGSPAAHLRVSLADKNGNLSAPWATKEDGMYYFYNVPFGNYFVTVAIVTPEGKPTVKSYPVSVSFYPYSDLPRLTLPDYVSYGSFTTDMEQKQKDAGLVGTWRSGNFAYTFFRDGTYVYVGAIVTPGMETKTSEKGTYGVNGDKLIIQRQSGIIVTSMDYKQDLKPETTVYPYTLGNTQNGRTLQLIFPDGRGQNFYRSN